MSYPVAFSTSVVKRALGNKFEAFCEQYQDAKLRRFYSEPTDKQYEMAEYAKKFGTRAAAKKFKVTAGTVSHAVYKVSRHYWLNK
jgi:hypothetical protein